jgi:hypothetical protein
MNKILQWLIVHLASWFHAITSFQLSKAIPLVVKAETVAERGAEKLKWFAEEFAKLNTGLQAWHSDGSPTNALLLLVSVAKDLAQKFGLIATPPDASS